MRDVESHSLTFQSIQSELDLLQFFLFFFSRKVIEEVTWTLDMTKNQI